MSLVYVARLLNGITQLPVQIYNVDSEIIYCAPDSFQNCDLIRPDFVSTPSLTPIPVIRELLAYYQFASPDHDGLHLILGPIWLKRPTTSDKELINSNVSLLNYLPIMSIEQFVPLVQLCYYTLYQREISSIDLLPKAAESIAPLQEALTTQNQFERREFSLPHNSYLDEIQLHEAVKSGDVALVRQLYAKPPTGTIGKLSNNPLRNQKNHFIAQITTLTRAAIEGGLANEEGYTMSDAYINRGENCTNIEDFFFLREQALIDFTQCIAKTKNCANSPIIKKCMDYISDHLHYSISLTEIAGFLNVSPSYLSRLFRKETGETLVSYIQKKRIHAAKNMLRFSDYTYLEIATYLNFKSQSYFTCVFKKFVGQTPMQFRNSLSTLQRF